MSRLLLLIDGDRVPTGLIGSMAAISGKGLGPVRTALGTGAPVLDAIVFPRGNDGMARRLRDLLRDLADAGISFRAYELLPGQRYEPGRTYYDLTADRLDAMIGARALSLRR